LAEQEMVESLLSGLTASQREVMRRIVDGLSPTEAARELGKTPETVRKTLYDARAKLVKLLNSGCSNQTPGGTTKSSTRDKKRDA
jgi:DNA-directed RNA polymerase specialized sigma24 family protein